MRHTMSTETATSHFGYRPFSCFYYALVMGAAYAPHASHAPHVQAAQWVDEEHVLLA